MTSNEGKHNFCLPDGQGKKQLGAGYSLPSHLPPSCVCSLSLSQPLLMASLRFLGPLVSGAIKRKEGKRRETWSLQALVQGSSNGCIPQPSFALSPILQGS